ncbi:MAG: hypothetical protein JXR16_13765 [Bermanella sp.]
MILDSEKEFKNKKYCYVQNGSSDLLIVLNTHNQKDRYFGYNSINNSIKDIDLLFLVDPNNKYYLDADEGKVYKELLAEILLNYKSSDVSIVGTSMAGFAALHFGMEFGLNVVAINPQLNLDSAYELAWDDLKNTLSNLESKLNIEELILKKYSGQTLFFVFGGHRLDLQAYNEFLSLDMSDVSFYIRRIESPAHKFFLSDLGYLRDIHYTNKLLSEINGVLQP